jgi:formylglycine-generating enzyme required for sulfatase activity
MDATGHLTDAEKKGGAFGYKDGKWDMIKGLDWRKPGFRQDMNFLVVCVSWSDAKAYVEWLAKSTGKNYRLATEAEWEYACRAGSDSAYCFGDNEAGLGEYAWYGSNSGGRSHTVGRKRANAWGIHDMHGNVWEWVNDWYSEDYYVDSPRRSPTGPANGSYRVIRGGSWNDPAHYARSAVRSRFDPGVRGSALGFRLARTLP